MNARLGQSSHRNGGVNTRGATVRRWLVWLLFCVASDYSFAADLRNVLTDYQVSGWNQKDGLPPGAVSALAQDAEGYLWVGTESGLLRFDGVRFTPPAALSDVPLLKRPVRALLIARDGSLWVGLGAGGGVSRLRNDQHWNYGESDGLPPGAVAFLVQDARGEIWTGTTRGLFRFVNDRWERHAHAHGPPDGAAYSAYVSTTGDLIVGIASGIFKLPPGAAKFERMEELAYHTPFFYESPSGFAEDASGRIVVSDAIVGFRPIGAAPVRPDAVPRGRGRRLLRDRHQNLWVGTSGQGLWRVRLAQGTGGYVTERLTALTGLLSDGVASMLEDRDGNIWVGTTEGLNRLTRPKVAQITNIGLVIGVETTPDGSVWVGTVDELLKFADPTSDSPTSRIPLHGARLRALHSDRTGGLWIATSAFVARITNGRVVPVVLKGTPQDVDSITSDGAGGLWLHDLRDGLLHWAGGRLDRLPLPAGLERQRIGATYADSAGRAWFAFADGPLGMIDRGGSLRLYGPDDGVDGGPYRAIHEEKNSVIWFAGADGLTRLMNGRFRTVRRGPGFPLDLTAVIDDGARGLYLGTTSGIARINEDDFDAALTSGTFSYTLYDRSDGLAGFPLAYSTNRRVIRAKDNRLWFLTARGLTLLDPRALRDTRPPSPVRIESVVADDRGYAPSSNIALPAGTSRLEVTYTILNLTSPFRTRFRYKLEGFDATWVEAGARRQAFYTNLPPRKYRFHVVASSADGVSEASRAVWDFSIQPMFYQTTSFYGLGGLTLALAIAGAWQLRLRQVRRQFSLILGERVRVSREIHDTLLQSLVGLALQLDAISNDVDNVPSKTRAHFVHLRKQIEEYIREARQSIWNLRSPSLNRGNLAAALRDAGEHVTSGRHTQFALTVSGTPRQCPPKIEQHLLRIGREAVTNAVRHARANEVRVHLGYDEGSIVLRVSDDGRGFEVPRIGAQEGLSHYGLIGMKERADEVGGAMTISSSANHGTELTTVVPLP